MALAGNTCSGSRSGAIVLVLPLVGMRCVTTGGLVAGVRTAEGKGVGTTAPATAAGVVTTLVLVIVVRVTLVTAVGEMTLNGAAKLVEARFVEVMFVETIAPERILVETRF